VHNLRYAFRFIKASFTTAFKKAQLQEQWAYIALGNLILLLIWFLPLGLTVGLIGIRPIGIALIGLVSIFMFYSFYMWGEITREHATQMIASLFQIKESQGGNELQKGPLFKHWLDIFIWTLVLPVMRIQESLNQIFLPEKENQRSWMESHALMVPLISLEDISLKDAKSRINEMVSSHLLRFRPGLVKVDLVARVIQWMFGIIGILTGISVAVIIADPFTSDPWQRILGLGIGLLITWIFITLGQLFHSFTRSYYHTALYQWVRNVAEARQIGDPTLAVPPDILRLALGKPVIMKNKKER